MDGLELLGNQLKIKSDALLHANDWMEQKKVEWKEYIQQMKEEGNSEAALEDFDSFLKKDDGPAIDKIKLHIEAVVFRIDSDSES